ncbi:MAG: prohibitin family protein [Aggregatilineales bacterium]
MIYNIDSLADLLAFLAWAAFLFLLFYRIIDNTWKHGIRNGMKLVFQRWWELLLAIIPALIFTLAAMSIVFVEPTQTAVVISVPQQGGIRQYPLTSGLWLIYPIVERAEIYPIYQQTYTMSGNPMDGDGIGNDAIRARTSDGQEVSVDTSIIFAVNPDQVIQLHIDWQSRYIEDLIRPLIRGVVRRRVAGFTVNEVNSIKRQDLEQALAEELTQTLADHGLLVEEFLVRNIAFSPEYAASVEQKQVALEQAIQSNYEADRIRRLAAGRADEITAIADARAGALLIEAQAQSEALQLIANVLEQNRDLLTYRYIDKLSPNIQVMLLPSDAPFILPLPESDATTTGIPLTADEVSQVVPENAITPSQLEDILGIAAPDATPDPLLSGTGQ